MNKPCFTRVVGKTRGLFFHPALTQGILVEREREREENVYGFHRKKLAVSQR